MEEETLQFLTELENRHGGPIGYKTYSTWFASTDGTIREFGVFLYEINGVFYYEDFERMPSLFGFSLKPSKKRPAYVKMEGSFDPAAVISCTEVSKSQAQACADGYKAYDQIPEATVVQRIFSPLVSRLVFKEGHALFFEVIDRKAFKALFKGALDGSL
ncbi:MAG: hypothetical protein ACOXZ4_06855 [Sphaerochaetaceae bacterium]|jgi:hypothetical protein